jgi:hypothetical protein
MVPSRERHLTDMNTTRFGAGVLAANPVFNQGAPLQPSDLRLRELMWAHAKGYHSMVMSDAEMDWLCFTGLALAVLFLGVAIWSHRGERALRAKKPQRFRSCTKRRPKPRKHRKK